MAYNYDHDCPFEAFITNLGKYNEGELVGEWVKFPTTPEKLQEVFDRIGIDGQMYEEWFITDYDCYVDGLYDNLGEYESLDELNYLASKIEELGKWDFDRFEAAIECGEHTGSVKDFINLTDNLDCYDVLSEVDNHSDLGYYYVHEAGIYDLSNMGPLENYIDYEALGRDIALDESGTFTDKGYIVSGKDSFTEYYDGNRENIPEEYRAFAPRDDLEDVRLDASTDLAFDLDEFFRAHHPEYDATYQDAHPQKEALADSLLSGDTGKIRMTLAFLEQERGLAKEVAPLAERLTAYEDEYGIDTYSIYQVKEGEQTRSYRFEPLDRLERQGLAVDRENYNLVYAGQLTEQDSLEKLYQQFNMERPEDFRGRSMSVSDVVVLHQKGTDTAHYCDSFGFTEVPQFMEPEPKTPDSYLTGERIDTPRGRFSLTTMTKEQMGAAGYGFHHRSDNGEYLIMGNGTRAFAVAAEPVNYLKNAEMAMEDDFGMIDGVLNNGRRGEEVGTGKPSIRESLAEAKRECSERKPPDKAMPKKEAELEP